MGASVDKRADPLNVIIVPMRRDDETHVAIERQAK
jgi:hypothetical protein